MPKPAAPTCPQCQARLREDSKTERFSERICPAPDSPALVYDATVTTHHCPRCQTNTGPVSDQVQARNYALKMFWHDKIRRAVPGTNANDLQSQLKRIIGNIAQDDTVRPEWFTDWLLKLAYEE